MRHGTRHRTLAAASATAMAGAALVVVGAGTASAAPVKWNDGASTFTRTVSNETPNAGDTITVSTKFERTSATDEYVYYIEDHHDECLDFVEGSARRNGSENISQYVRENNNSAVIVDRKSPGWRVSNLAGTKQTQTVSLQYLVTENCTRATPLNTGLKYSGSLGGGSYTTKGPSVTVGKNSSTTSLAPVSGARVGVTTNLTATVTGAAPGDTVEFYSGGTRLGGGQVDGEGVASFEWTPTVKGAVALQARLPESGRAKASQSAVQNVTVSQPNVDSTTTLASVSAARVGLGSMLTATVSPASGGGTVTFKDEGQVLATVAVSTGGQATYSWTPQSAGTRTITAEFAGRDGTNPSSATQTVTVDERPVESVESTTSLDSVGPLDVGDSVRLTARVSPADAGGTVTFKDGDKVIGMATVDGQGIATFEWTPAEAGQRTIAAEYSGKGNVQGSNDSMSVLVNAAVVPEPEPEPGDGSGSLGSLTGSLGGESGGMASGSTGSLSAFGS